MTVEIHGSVPAAAALAGLLIGGPIVAGGLLLACRGWGSRAALTILAALGVMAGGIGLALQGAGEVAIPSALAAAAPAVEAAIVAAILWIGYRIGSGMIVAMCLAQLGLVAAGLNGDAGGGEHGSVLVLDRLALIMVLIVSVVGSLIALYAIGYMRAHAHHTHERPFATSRFFAVLVAFLGLMNGLVLTDNLVWLAIFWEGTTLCSFLLIGHDGTDEARANARRALLLNTFGGLAMSGAVYLAAHGGGSESLAGLIGRSALLPVALLALATMTKSAQLPFQSWLLGAMVAPTPVSALLHSSTMVKAGSYLILRLAPAMADTPVGMIVAIAGGFTFVVTSALAIGQSNAKKVLAYSTIANLGLIAACAGIGTPLAMAAAVMLMCFHAVSKALLFLCVGTIEQTIGSRHIEDMSGILFKMPVTTTIAIVGMVSMMAPPFGMLMGKWLAIESAVHMPAVLLLFVLGSALTIFFWAKWIGRITTASYHPEYRVEEVSRGMIAVLVTLLLMAIAGAFLAMPLFRSVLKPMGLAVFAAAPQEAAGSVLESVEGLMQWPLFAILGMVLLAVLLSLRGFRRSHVRLPFLCGENLPDGETTFEFRSVAGGRDTALVTSYYLSSVFNEPALTAWCNAAAVLILFTLFGVIAAP